ncbi:class I SAM-dependent methyltransferase [Geminocystis sp. GBBB08]|uniref:class I SAM-dependent methyltransferase n=1 Tax=Geminocystis sp. GBBB08 TaxID=2604140 RepID=UPI0029279A25|nr:class I SAM-dependent methyltransferase [Geminocystis sp. GBBB08]
MNLIDKNNPLLAKIFETINNSPEKIITFAEYMNLCLYDPEYGYYNSAKIIIGNQGDFFTSSSLSSDFGELLAIQLEEFWQVLGKPSNFKLVEMGAGNGNLALTIINYLFNHYPNFASNIEYIIIEKSQTLKVKQQQLFSDNLANTIQIKWEDWDSIPDNSIIGCFFSNELVDAMPVHLIRYSHKKLEEIYLTEKGNQLLIKYDSLSSQDIYNYFEILDINFDKNIYPDDYHTEVNLNAIDWLSQVFTKLKQGYLLTIDYGYTAKKYYHPQRSQGTLKCYYQHRHHHNPYVNIGSQDITSHVNFTALEKYGELLGLSNLAYTKQALFLMSLGLGDRLSELSDGKMSLRKILQRREELHNLINPEGLGNFGVLLQTKNLTTIQSQFSLQGFY